MSDIKRFYVSLMSIIILLTMTGCTNDDTLNDINLESSTVAAPAETRYADATNPKYKFPISIIYSINSDNPKLWKEMLAPREAESLALINDLSLPEQLDFYFESCEATHGKYTFSRNSNSTNNTFIPRTLLECNYNTFNSTYELKITYSYTNSAGYYDRLNNEVILIGRKKKLINIHVFSGLSMPSTTDEAERYGYGLTICIYTTNKNQSESRIQKVIHEFRPEYEHSSNYYLHAYCDRLSDPSHCYTYIENYGVSNRYNAIIKVMQCPDTISDQINYVPIKIVN